MNDKTEGLFDLLAEIIANSLIENEEWLDDVEQEDKPEFELKVI